MAFCLLKNKSEEFLQKIKSGEININKLSEMTSAERRAEFQSVMNFDVETAKEINALFESKLLLKYQKTGMKSWIEKVGGLKPEVKQDLITKIDRMQKVLNPEEESKFLADVAAKKLGVEVTQEEAKIIFKKSQKIDELSQKMDTFDDRVKYGRAVMDLQEYVHDLQPNEIPIIINVIGFFRTMKTVGDMGVLLRQGRLLLGRKEWFKAIGKVYSNLKSAEQYKNMLADISTRPTYNAMKKSGLRLSAMAGDKLSKKEEDFMSTITGKIPGLRGIERANIGFLTQLRADVFDTAYAAAELRGEDITSEKVLKDIANSINDATMSGNLGKNDKYANAAPVLNALFYSARKVSAALYLFNPASYVKVSKTARNLRLHGLLSLILGTIATNMIAQFFIGEDQEENPLSSDFGKTKIDKNTRVDFTGGFSSYLVLAARLAKGATKSSTTGKTKKLGEGYKADTRFDITERFLTNKLAPVASLLTGWLMSHKQGKKTVDPSGREINLKNTAEQLMMPMMISDLIEMSTDKKTSVGVKAVSTLLNFFGASSMRY